MATRTQPRDPTLADDLSTLSQISASTKAAEQLSAALESEEVSFEEDIPTLDHQPNLEDILNEDESSAPTLDELGISEVLGEGKEDPPSTPATSRQGTSGTTQATAEGAILRHTVLKAIANQLSQATTHSEAGLPTALAVGKYYAIGTSHGLVLVFDLKEQLKCVLSPYQKGGTAVDVGQYGAVSCLDLSSDGTRLLSGYAKGLITHWDLTTSKCLRFIDSNAHPPGFGVLSVKFTMDPTTIIFNNNGGNVFVLKFKRTLGVRSWNSECFFSGCHGEALAIEPLLVDEAEESSLKGHSVVALATVTKVLILSITPTLEGLITLPLKAKAKCLPQLAWNHVVIEHRSSGGTYSTVDPVLAAARGNKVYYIQSFTSAEGAPQFRQLRKFEVPYDIASFRWINAHTVVAMDTTERIHLVSVRDDAEIEVLDLRQVELVYGSSFFKSIETGGNVSRALRAASVHACYNSVLSYQNQLLLLGLKAVHLVTIKPWKERLGRLVRDGRLVEALKLGLDLYDGRARAVVGLSGVPKKRRELVAEQVMDILQAYIDIGVMMHSQSARMEKELRQHYKTLVVWAFDCCLKIKKTDLLFGSIYDTFNENNLSKTVFLEQLCGHIQEKRVHHLRTVVTKDFIAHYSHLGEYKLLESCILQLNPKCLDIHQVIEMCWSQQLYDAMIHVYNKGLNDYTTPLLELLLQLRAALKKGKPLPDDYQKVGYKLLVYIRCCLAGLSYPAGNIPKNVVALAKVSVYEAVLAPTNTHNPSDKDSYPHMRTLLNFDTREFLNVLAMAFEETDFDAAISEHPPSGIPTRQEVVDILLHVMVRGKEHTFSPSQVGSLFTFLARQGAKHRASIQVDEHIYDQVLDYITHAEEDVVNEERQQALLELWHAGVLKKFDEEKLLVNAESAKFYRLCELLYEKKRQFAKVLSCYLRDPNRRHQAFSYIHAVMNEDLYTEPDREEVAKEVLDNFQVLIQTDVRGTSRLVLMDFPLELAELTYKLHANAEVQYDFLQGIFDPKSVSKQEIAPPSHVVERYIELLCRYQPEGVYNFLRSNDNYRIEEAQDACAKARLLDATAYLLERSGDIMGAFKLILETLAAELDTLSESHFNERNPGKDMTAKFERVERILKALLQFCQRNSSRLEDKARQAMWFPTFDKIHGLQKKYGESPNTQLTAMYNTVIGEILNSMLGYIGLPSILQKIIQDPSYQFKDIKQLIMGMLETYSYEEVSARLKQASKTEWEVWHES